MMKKGILLLFIFISSSVFSDDLIITKEYLLNSRSDMGFHEDSFYIEFGYGGFIRGKYRIENNSVIITPKEINHYKLGHLLNKEIHYKAVRNKNDIYTDMFVCTDNYKDIELIKFFKNISTKIPEGCEVVLNPDIEFVALENYTALVIDNVNVRDYPDIKANKYIIDYADDKMKSIKCLSKGQQLYVMGRTKNKVRVQKWVNYWYLVELMLYDYDYIHLENKNDKPKTLYYWVYGEFIKKIK